MKILVAEDDRVSRRVVASVLGKVPHEVLAVSDGMEAWQALRALDAPPLALLDWMMPGMDGVEVCRRVRGLPTSTPTYIILLTAKSSREDIVEGLQAGADDYLTKPVDPEELRARVEVGARTVRLQRSLAEREARLSAMVQGSYDGIVVMDGEGTLRDLNPAAEKIFGWSREEAVGKVLSDLVMPERYREAHRRGLARYLAAGEARVLGKRLEVSALRRTGEEFPIELSVAAIQTSDGTMFSAIIRDVTERKRLEVELRHAQKLESVGQLAAGIAHEINTPIQFVGDNTRFLKDSFASLSRLIEKYHALHDAAERGTVDAALLAEIKQADEEADVAYLAEEVPKAIDQTLDGVDRVATIVRAMKDFAHPDPPQKSPADLNQALRSTLAVARSELKYVADVETEFGELPTVVCHVGDLNQVFLNLLVNAAHAIADGLGQSGEKGRIRVRTARESDSVVIAVSDTGTGIPENIRTKVFDPFFTTKDVGRGTGQGLAIARAIIVEKHGGSLTFETEPGRGTTFFVRLPVDGKACARTGELAA